MRAKELLRWNKNHFSSFLKGIQLPKNISDLRVCLKTFFTIKVLGMCVSYAKRYFLLHKGSVFYLGLKLLRVFLVRNAGLRTFWEQNISKHIFFSMKVLSIFLAFVKKHSQLMIVSLSFFMAQNTAIFLFLLMPVLERLKAIVWEEWFFKIPIIFLIDV